MIATNFNNITKHKVLSPECQFLAFTDDSSELWHHILERFHYFRRFAFLVVREYTCHNHNSRQYDAQVQVVVGGFFYRTRLKLKYEVIDTLKCVINQYSMGVYKFYTGSYLKKQLVHQYFNRWENSSKVLKQMYSRSFNVIDGMFSIHLALLIPIILVKSRKPCLFWQNSFSKNKPILLYGHQLTWIP